MAVYQLISNYLENICDGEIAKLSCSYEKHVLKLQITAMENDWGGQMLAVILQKLFFVADAI